MKHIQWGCHLNFLRGNTLRQIAHANNYLIFSLPNSTYWPTSTLFPKAPGYSIYISNQNTNRFHSKIENTNDLLFDHSPVLLTLNKKLPIKTPYSSITSGITNWKKYQLILNENINLKTHLKFENDINTAVHILTKTIKTAA